MFESIVQRGRIQPERYPPAGSNIPVGSEGLGPEGIRPRELTSLQGLMVRALHQVKQLLPVVEEGDLLAGPFRERSGHPSLAGFGVCSENGLECQEILHHPSLAVGAGYDEALWQWRLLKKNCHLIQCPRPPDWDLHRGLCCTSGPVDGWTSEMAST